MCGIVGCTGHEKAIEVVTHGLEALEYRGYDSAGIAYADPGKGLEVVKAVGEVSVLTNRLPVEATKATTAMGHTRWATHGEPSERNAHPQTNANRRVAVVHNGTIENYMALREELGNRGYSFESETDTEVIPHLLDYYLKEGQAPDEAFNSTVNRLMGAYAILALLADKPDTLYVARLGSPLVLGLNGQGHYAASDHNVIAEHTAEAVFLEDREIAKLSPTGYNSWRLEGQATTRPAEMLGELQERAVLGEFPHFMLKEIYDSPETVRTAISGRVHAPENLIHLGGLAEKSEIKEKLRHLERLIIVGCGTSYHAGLIGERLIEEIAGIPVEVQLASEFKYKDEPYQPETAVLAISQSGETADTIAAIQKANDLGLLTLGVNNAPGSTIDRITEAGVHCRAGQEVSVASTKAFTSQVTVLAEIALALRSKVNHLQRPLMNALAELPDKIEAVLNDTTAIEDLAKKYAHYKNFLYIGRGYGHPSALEGALKLKEISYIHAEGCGAGEMKHGTLALIDPDFPTFAIATEASLYPKIVSNIEEIRSRKGPVIGLATEGNTDIAAHVDEVLYVPETMEQVQPILNGIVMQLFAYYIAIEKGLNVDRPRNLAKSVTVE